MEWSGKLRSAAAAALISTTLLPLLITAARAVPVFSRKYQTSCSTCHYAFPQLNAFGKAFQNNGWRYPGGDANFRKEEPTSLGSEAYKQIWPNSIWPSDIPEWNRAPAFNVTAGSIHFDPSPGDFSLIPSDNNVTTLTSRNGWSAADEMPGLDIWGAGNGSGGKGGWKYTAGIVQGQGLSSFGADKDYFAQVRYKIGGLGEIGGTQGQASSTSAFYEDNNATLGGYVYSGTVAGDVFSDREDLNVWALTADLWYKRAILNATFMDMGSKFAHALTPVPDRKSQAWYAQGQYVIYPWLIGLARYEATTIDTDVDSKAETTLIPAIVSMVRANVKVTLEYRRPITHYDARKVDEEHLLFRLDFAM
jgi:hypothetical protein